MCGQARAAETARNSKPKEREKKKSRSVTKGRGPNVYDSGEGTRMLDTDEETDDIDGEEIILCDHSYDAYDKLVERPGK